MVLNISQIKAQACFCVYIYICIYNIIGGKFSKQSRPIANSAHLLSDGMCVNNATVLFLSDYRYVYSLSITR